MAGINIKIDNKDFSAQKFAKEIKFEEIAKNIKNIDKQILAEMYNSVAGEDGIMQGTELEAFLHKIEIASKDGILEPKELDKIAESRARSLAGIYRGPHYKDFIKALFNINNQKVAAEETANAAKEPQKAPTDRYYDNGKITKKVIHEDKYDREQQFKNGKLVREIYTDKNGNVIKDKTIDKDGNQTFHKKSNDDRYDETFVIYDKNNKKIGEGVVEKGGNTVTKYLDEKGKVTKEVEKDSYRVRTNIFNERGLETESHYKSSDGGSSVTKYTYDKEGNKLKGVTKDSDGWVRTSYYENGNLRREVSKDPYNNYTTTQYFNDNFNITKEVHKDENGKLIDTTTYTYKEGCYDPVKEVTKNAKGEVTSTVERKFYREGNVKEEVINHDDGSKQIVKYDTNFHRTSQVWQTRSGRVETITYNTQGNEKHLEVKDKDGKLLNTVDFSYNVKGEKAKEILRDADGNITKTLEYNRNGHIERDRNGNVVESWDFTDTKKGHIATRKNGRGETTFTSFKTKNGYTETQYYHNEPICSEEYNAKTKSSVYRDGEGNIISEKEYDSFYKIARQRQKYEQRHLQER